MRRPICSAALACAAVLAVAAVVGLPAAPAAADGPPLVRAPGLSAPPAPSGSVTTGTLPSGQQVPIRVVLPPSDQAGIRHLLRSLQDPSSPEYHHWLAPGQFAARFAPSAASVAAVESWLRGRGLSGVSASGFAVQASGDASAMSHALGVHFDRYRAPNGHRGYRATTAPLVPSPLASGQVQAIVGLDSTTPFQPQVVPAPPGAASVPGGGQLAAAQPAADGLTACTQAKAAAGSSYSTLDEVGAYYGIGSLLADGQNGRGQTVGVYELSPSSSADVNTYKSCFGLTNPVSVVKVAGGAGSSQTKLGTLEADLDIEQVATQAPGASIISYEGPNNSAGGYDTWYAIVSADTAKVVSTSWEDCGDAELAAYDPLFEIAATQGQTILAASGDQGSEGCYTPQNGDTALAVDYPASSSYVTAVGGTSYAPGDEVTWNECEGMVGTSCAAAGGAAGGGGISGTIPRPSWQPASTYSGSGCGGGGCRAVPDLSANAKVDMVVYDSAYGGWVIVGGTSVAAPLVAGLVADRNVGCASGTGDLAPTLYSAAGQGLYGTGLTDVTSGDNDLTRTNGGKYPAAAGYDPATGLGSPLAAGLSCAEVTGVNPSTAPAGSTVTVSGLGLEHATVSFGGAAATVTHASATSATVVVPNGTGTVSVSATSVLGAGTAHASFTYGTTPSAVATSAKLTASANPATAGRPVTFTATVTSLSGAAPTGQVAFTVDGSAKACGDQSLAPAGNRATATCRVTFPKAGTSHVVQARYLGADYAFTGSTAPKLTETVHAPPATSSANLSSDQSLTAGHSLSAGAYRLTMQSDGNLVEYQGSRALWASGTGGHPGTGVVMQKDGNLVEYQAGKAIWASFTAGHPGAHLTLQASDGNVVIYGPAGRALWATGT